MSYSDPLFREVQISFDSPVKQRCTAEDTTDKGSRDSVIIRNSIHFQQNPLFSPYVSNDQEKLNEISENTIENFPSDSLGNTGSGYIDSFGVSKTSPRDNGDSSANYKSEDTQNDLMNTIKSFHGHQARRYFGE